MNVRYKKGDKVILTDVRPRNWGSVMDDFLGITVTVRAVGNTSSIYFEELPTQQYSFEKTNVVGFADPEVAEKRIAEYAEQAAKYCVDLEVIEQIAIEVFGEERVDFIKRSETSSDVTIHFPEYTISNSREDTHVIKDMYVRFRISMYDIFETSKLSIIFDGLRTKVSLKEYICSYGHSHLPNHSLCSFNNFCLGSSEFGMILHSIQLEPTAENWFLLFFSTENYLIWESLEGGPYRRMAELSYNISQTTTSADVEIYKLLPNVPTEVFTYNDGVQLNENHPLLFDYYSENSKTRNLGITKERIKAILENKRRDVNGLTFKFKESLIPAELYDDDLEEKEEEKGEKEPISRDIVNYYNQLLKQELNKFNLNYGYESAKTLRCQTVFGEVGTI